MDKSTLSHLFTIRLWLDSADPDELPMRIRVHHVLSGDVRYFQGWADVLNFIVGHSKQGEESGSEKLNSKTEKTCNEKSSD